MINAFTPRSAVKSTAVPINASWEESSNWRFTSDSWFSVFPSETLVELTTIFPTSPVPNSRLIAPLSLLEKIASLSEIRSKIDKIADLCSP